MTYSQDTEWVYSYNPGARVVYIIQRKCSVLFWCLVLLSPR